MAKGKKMKVVASDDSSVTRGTGNVFADLGFRNADELQLKAELTRQIHNRIKGLGLRQTEAGSRLGISQPDVSRLMSGRYTGFSADRLIGLLNDLGVDVQIILRARSRSARPTRGTWRITER